jgi:catechol 2,3-dioxygenase-like lactoylglutathione lyase family enzyme
MVERPAAAGGAVSGGEPAGILALDHVQLAMPRGSEEEARAFYAGVLGMEEVPKPEPMRAAGGAWFRAGGAELHLGVEEDFRPARKAHPALRAGDLDALAERCAAAGHPVEWDVRFPGVRRFYVADPFGNRIEILRPEP